MPYSEILNRLKLTDGYPIVNLIGAWEAPIPKNEDAQLKKQRE